MNEKYIHGYSQTEQNRLVAQGQVLSPYIFDRLNLSAVTHLLEVGSGVGAMTLEIARRYPSLPITCLEISETQIKKAKDNLSQYVINNEITLLQADARNTGLEDNASFDGAFLCWILEHVPSPERVLKELRRILKPNGEIFITEVFHDSLQLYPYCPNASLYWKKCIDFQAIIEGDANVGHRLGNLLFDAGFREIEVRPYPMFFDKRNLSARLELLNYWHDLMLSALDNMLSVNYCELSLWKAAQKELLELMENDETVFYYSFVQGIARK